MVWFVDFELKYPRVLVPLDMVFYSKWNGREWVKSWLLSEKDDAKIVVVKKWPLRSRDFAAGAKHRFMFHSKELMRGGIRLFKEGDDWVRRLPYGVIKYGKAPGYIGSTISANGYIVLERAGSGEYRVTGGRDYDAMLHIIENYVHSRTCSAGLEVKVVKGEGYAWCDSTSTRIDSIAACLVIAKPGTVLEISKDTGPYRGECDTIVEKKQILFDEEKKEVVLMDYEDVEENEIV